MTVIYQTTITRIGQSAPDALCDQMLITFRAERSGISRHRACRGACTGRYRTGLYFEVCRLRREK